MKKHWKKLLWLVPVLLLVVAAAVYVNDYYHALPVAQEALGQTMDSVTIEVGSDYYAFIPDEIKAGFLFYPGGKVAYEAYAPLLRACAEKGILCVALKMPGNLAVLNPNAAKKAIDKFPQMETWFIGGHSLGGSMAASFAAGHEESICGVILLASYATKDISHYPVLSIYGTQDGVMNKENYDKNTANLPDGFTELVIPGGCHAWFGSYGHQNGDGAPTIAPEEQQVIAAAAIVDFILK